ncbi:MAG: acetyl-CoA carboxylase biotin carboxyl carrier protein [Candidatus Eremiobacteraeota bacterium]|nr:acetyl-CoA carboxylase biotin carboxyl carrier protein [Candidatus Eremiobacteraeota bacterium]MBV9055685.1 acetyl-CoA carboxylase biotin carboxyl carrier protein [Candidatus Eremiobacteraeota bacterium]MBV9698919.1 acetyl-CoA carboxylase biotin carboxyl carrier protein [Candidatus Eremiobacteraeota bacterium]
MEERYAQEAATLKELLAIMREHDLDLLRIRLGDAVYELQRGAGDDGGVGTPETVDSSTTRAAPAEAGANVSKVLAPLTGVFYRAASPDAQPFVEVGDRVAAGDILCVLEAMKLFNEIQSDDSGTILRIVAENGELVSQGQELFWIQR